MSCVQKKYLNSFISTCTTDARYRIADVRRGARIVGVALACDTVLQDE